MTTRWHLILAATLLVGCVAQLSADLGGGAGDRARGGATLGDAMTPSSSATGADDGGATDDASAKDAGTAPVMSDAAQAATGTEDGDTSDAIAFGDGGLPSDLPPPTTGAGIQIVSPSNAYVLPPNQELFQTFCVDTTADIQVGGFQSWMSEGGHHMVVYRGGVSPSSCAVATNTRLYASYTANVAEMDMPAGVALPLADHTQLVVSIHFVNATSSTLYPQIKLNLIFATNVQYAAGIMQFSYGGTLVVPATSPVTGSGSTAISGTCNAPVGSKFFWLTAYGEGLLTEAALDLVNGAQSTEIVRTGRLDAGQSYPPAQVAGTGDGRGSPGVAEYPAPNFLMVHPGDSFSYDCSYSNASSSPETLGTPSEVCAVTGYYFPSGSATCP